MPFSWRFFFSPSVWPGPLNEYNGHQPNEAMLHIKLIYYKTFHCREREGRQLLEECLLINERYKGSNHPDSVTHLLNLATSYSRSKNFVEAERLLRLSLHIISRTVGPEDNSITIPMLHLAVVLYHLKQDEEAETLALEAVRIRETIFGKQSLPVGKHLFS